jgi:hypothetical protein
VHELPSRGVGFEQHDLPGLRTASGIAEIEGNYPSKGIGERAAWFPDSEGNMLGIAQPAALPRKKSTVSFAAWAATSTVLPELSFTHHRSSAEESLGASIGVACDVAATLAFAYGCCGKSPSPPRSLASTRRMNVEAAVPARAGALAFAGVGHRSGPSA